MPVALSISSNINKQQIIHNLLNGKLYAGTFLAPFHTSKALNKEKQEEEEQSENRNTVVMCTDSRRNTACLLCNNEICFMKQMACVSGF